MRRYVVIRTPSDKIGRDLAWLTCQGAHLFMDFVTLGLWIPVHVRSSRKLAIAFQAAERRANETRRARRAGTW